MTEPAVDLVPPPQARPNKSTNFKQVLLFSLVIALSFTLGLGGFLFTNLKLQKSSQGYVAQAVKKRPTPAPSPTPDPTPQPTPNLTPQPEQITNPPSGHIIFVNQQAIWKINPDRTQAAQIVPPDEHDKLELTLSPDRQKLAYIFLPQNESERHAPPNGRPYSGVSLVNLSDNTVTPIFPLKDTAYSHLAWSPDSRYLSAWVNDGQKTILYDLDQKAAVLSFETQDTSGTSPFVWIPGQPRLSFILQGELFTVLADGSGLQSLAKNATARSAPANILPKPLPPIWSPDGNHVAFFQDGKLTHLNLHTRQTTAISPQSAETVHPIAFSSDNQDIILSFPQAVSKTARYNLTTQKITELPNLQPNYLFKNDTFFGISPEDSHTLTWYPLPGTKSDTCSLNTPSSQLPLTTLPTSSRLQALNADSSALVSLAREENFDKIQIINLKTCQGYDLIRGQNLDNPIWLPE